MDYNERELQETRTHNTVLFIMTVTCIGAIIESVTQHWEFWMPPLIIAGLIGCWGFHITQYRQRYFRENIYMLFSILVVFYYGVHRSSFFDVIVISTLLMGTATLIKRRIFLRILLIEFFMIMFAQIAWGIKSGNMEFDSLLISRIILHLMSEICIYKALEDAVKSRLKLEQKLELREKEKETEQSDMEDFLVNISHELRTPVNVINGMTTLILKKEDREDVTSIRDAGFRLSHQIEDIQDYSEIQRGDVILEEDKYMIPSILNDIAATFSILGKSKRYVEFVIDLDPELPMVLRGDSAKINKIMTHLLDNAFKFTRKGAVYLRITGIRRDYGINLIIEVTDTGTGMTRTDIEKISKGRYQANQKRNRSTGGIGLGLSIVYGFVRKMNGFVSIESSKKKGTTVSVSIAQEIVDPSPCLSVNSDRFINIIFHVIPEKYSVAEVREYYRNLAMNMAAGLRLNLYSAPSIKELKNLLMRGDITHIFMGAEEYMLAAEYFDKLAENDDLIVAVSAGPGFKQNSGSKVILMPKPLNSYQVTRVLNGDHEAKSVPPGEEISKPYLDGVRALIVDDERMNLVVASGLFKEYNMIIDTAESGREAIDKYAENDYDVVFMDHMMPEMDGVEAMKRIREVASQDGRTVRIIALTANAISGAKEMFIREGFDGFIAKPINITAFERVMGRMFKEARTGHSGGAR